MAYRVEYNGEEIELATLDDALDCARNAIANDVDRFDGWAVEHDEELDDWYVQAVRDGRRVGPTAVISGPPVDPRDDPHFDDRPEPVRDFGGKVVEEWERRVAFVGRTPAEAFALAADWLGRRPDIDVLGDVGWHHTASGHQLRIYYRD
jgi:hypothetical protein